ncbi:hypothetical protein FQR65_LT15416 [Abscondita terminalis]|nr:hypothetical protein FQR65_LT15416 [Abscondita terminalis]
MPVNEKTKQPFGLLHGGASVVLAESVGSIASNMVVNDEKYMGVGLEINANHIRSATDKEVTAVCSPLHIGATTHGAAMALLQTAVNPYLSIIGPIESAAQRISIAGLFNKGAGITKNWPLNDEVRQKSAFLDDLLQRVHAPYIALAVIFVVFAIIIRFAHLPDVEVDKEESSELNASDTQQKQSVFQFPHLFLGSLAIFFCVLHHSKTTPPLQQVLKTSWSQKAWKGEKVGIQAVLWSSKDFQDIELSATDLTSDSKNTISADHISISYVSYVMSDLIGKLKSVVDTRFGTGLAVMHGYLSMYDSIRFEKLIEGIQDAEKIRIIREKLKGKGKTAELNKLESVIQEFNNKNIHQNTIHDQVIKAHMKKSILTLLVASALAFGAQAQLKIPQPSSATEVTQAIGIHNVVLKYSRPNTNGRTIFGDLVPYGTVWAQPELNVSNTDI